MTSSDKPGLEPSTGQEPATGLGLTAPISKLDRLIALLQQRAGADMPAMIAATGWQAHSVRGALAGALRKKGHQVRSEKSEAGRVWRITPAEPQA